MNSGFYFFMEDDLVEEQAIVRHNHRKVLKNPNSNVVYELLSPTLNKAMEIVAVTLHPGEHSSDIFFSHKGEEACYVLSGKTTAILGEISYVLEKGDCIQFQAEIPHKYINDDTSKDTDLLFILTPPSF